MDFSAEKLFLFVLFALPGAVAIRVYSLWCPTAAKDWKETIVDAVIYSSVGLGMWCLLDRDIVKGFVLELMATQKDGVLVTTQSVDVVFSNYVPLILYVFATPTALTFIWYYFRLGLLHSWLGFDHPTRTAWDWVFSRGHSHYILFHLKTKNSDNTQVIRIGYFNGRSYVTSHPYDAEIYCERIHQMNADGTVGMPIVGSTGLLIRISECERLEFLFDPTPLKPTLRRRIWRRAYGSPRFVLQGCVKLYGYRKYRLHSFERGCKDDAEAQ